MVVSGRLSVELRRPSKTNKSVCFCRISLDRKSVASYDACVTMRLLGTESRTQKRRITQHGPRPQPRNVLTQRHQDTKGMNAEMPPKLCGFVALCENQVSVFQGLCARRQDERDLSCETKPISSGHRRIAVKGPGVRSLLCETKPILGDEEIGNLGNVGKGRGYGRVVPGKSKKYPPRGANILANQPRKRRFHRSPAQ